MTRAEALEAKIAAVARLRDAAPSEAGGRQVRDALGERSGRMILRGAQVALAWREAALVPDLLRSFERLIGAGAKIDPGCVAKTALVDALGAIGEEELDGDLCERVFLPGARHQQWEPVRGGRVDTAGALRAACAAGLEAWHHPRTLEVLADHLADPLGDVRVEAARSIARRGREDGAPLLRLRLGMGDEVAAVIGECCRALLAVAPGSSLDLVAARLETQDDEAFGEVALALGESRAAGAADALIGTWRQTFDLGRRQVLLAAVAALRSEEGISFLLRRVAEEAPDLASEAVTVLAAYAADSALRARVAAAVETSGDEAVSRCFTATFEA